MKTPHEIAMFILANQNLFKPGTTFNESVITAFMDIDKPKASNKHDRNLKRYTNYATQKGFATSEFNKVLHTQGLHLSRHKHTDFVVKTKDGASSMVNVLSAQAVRIQAASRALDKGLSSLPARAAYKYTKSRNQF